MLAPNPLTGRSGSAASGGRFSRAGGAAGGPRAAAVKPVGAASSEPAGTAIIKSLLTALLLWLLVWEWLRPLPMLSEVTELYLIKPFMIAFGLSLLLDGVRIPPAWSASLKALIVLSLIGYLFYPGQEFGVSWLGQLAGQVKQDAYAMLQGQYDQVSGETRTLLFAAGWSMIISVVHALLIQRQQALWLGLMTMLYLILLQLFFGIDTVEGIIRTFIWTGLLLALLLPDGLKRKFGVTLSSGKALRATATAAALVALCVSAGLFGWKPDNSSRLMAPFDYSLLERWPFTSFGASGVVPAAAGSALSARTGYGTDDSVLGGPIMPDPEVVFQAKTSELTYWRGESKDYYDGKGWHQSTSRLRDFSALHSSDPQGDSAVKVRQEVMLPPEHPTRLLFLGGPLSEAQALISPADHLMPQEYLRYDETTGSYSLPELSDPVSYYEVEALVRSPAVSQLKEDKGAYPAEMTDTYLQLPQSLPERVRQLAQNIVAGKQGSYEKAAAIADYLRSHYKYSLNQPTMPPSGEDFVDHFLFEDQTGYCDHFSTAMTVMLRAVGVPARWVKGFAPGTEEAGAPDEGSGGLHQVTVRNLDAHAWVEVGFPSLGWVAFDPTPGFSGAGMADLSKGDLAAGPLTASAGTTMIDASSVDQASKTLPANKRETSIKEMAAAAPKLEAYPAVATAMQTWEAAIAWMRGHVRLTAVGLLLAGTMIIVLYLVRSSLLLAAFTVRSPRGKAEPHSGIVAFMDRLWIRIHRIYGQQLPTETVREYVSRLDIRNERASAALQEFARLYEMARYDTARRLPVARRAVYELWKRMAEPR